MEVTNGLLVAMMFIMVLSIGIGNILLSLPPLLNRRAQAAAGNLALSWLALILLMHLNLFWQVLRLLDIDPWVFPGFLYVVSGPILLLLATSLLLPDPSEPRESADSRFIESARPAFALLGAVMAWFVGFDLMFGDGLGLVTLWNVAALLLFGFLASSRDQKVHGLGAGAGWALFLTMLVARGLGLVT
jgi:hypothetical protein